MKAALDYYNIQIHGKPLKDFTIYSCKDFSQTKLNLNIILLCNNESVLKSAFDYLNKQINGKHFKDFTNY